MVDKNKWKTRENKNSWQWRWEKIRINMQNKQKFADMKLGRKYFTSEQRIGYNSQRFQNPESTQPIYRMIHIPLCVVHTQKSIKPNGKLRNIARYKYRTNSIRNLQFRSGKECACKIRTSHSTHHLVTSSSHTEFTFSISFEHARWVPAFDGIGWQWVLEIQKHKQTSGLFFLLRITKYVTLNRESSRKLRQAFNRRVRRLVSRTTPFVSFVMSAHDDS